LVTVKRRKLHTDPTAPVHDRHRRAVGEVAIRSPAVGRARRRTSIDPEALAVDNPGVEVPVHASPSLALLGGSPAFAADLHVGKPNIGDRKRLMARFEDILERRWFTNDGVCVKELERKIADLLGVRYCIAMCNATVALEIVTRAVGMRGEVIVPSFTFVATAHALEWQDVTPVFCDVDPRTHTIDPSKIERMITPRTTGIVGVHLWGQGCDVDAIGEIARRHRLRVVYDAAHAFACTHRGRPIGGFGDAEVFSFHATKFFNAAEGGCVTTNDPAIAKKVALMRNFGFAGYDNVVHLGTNGKMDEFSAAVGLTNLESLDEFLAVNRRNYERYASGLAGCPGLRLYEFDRRERFNYQYVVLEVNPVRAGITRDELLAVLHSERVLARRYFFPGCHRMEPYRSYFPNAGLLLPQTERLSERVLVLPTGTAVDVRAIDRICGLLRTAIARNAEVREALAREVPADGRPAKGEPVPPRGRRPSRPAEIARLRTRNGG
jgi:dTDP-4-amino-4,6-dideoxygalactose transaminase